MRNKIGLGICIAGFLGICAGIMALDSEVTTALTIVVISALVFAVGYLMTDMDAVLNDAGLQKVKENKEILARKAKNRQKTWEAWIATTKGR